MLVSIHGKYKGIYIAKYLKIICFVQLLIVFGDCDSVDIEGFESYSHEIRSK